MRFTQALLAAASIAVSSAVYLTNTEFNLAVGQTFTITFKQSVGPTEIFIGGGALEPSTLTSIATVGAADNVNGASVDYLPTQGGSQLAFVIIDHGSGDAINYSQRFDITGGSSSVSSTASSTTTSTNSQSTTTNSAYPTASTAVSSANSTSTSTTMTTAVTKVGNYSKTTTTLSGTGGQTGAISTSTGSGTTSPSSIIQQVNGASGLASPFAFVFLALAALVTLN